MLFALHWRSDGRESSGVFVERTKTTALHCDTFTAVRNVKHNFVLEPTLLEINNATEFLSLNAPVDRYKESERSFTRALCSLIEKCDHQLTGTGLNFFVIFNDSKTPKYELVFVISAYLERGLLNDFITLAGMLSSSLGYARVRRSVYVTDNTEVYIFVQQCVM